VINRPSQIHPINCTRCTHRLSTHNLLHVQLNPTFWPPPITPTIPVQQHHTVCILPVPMYRYHSNIIQCWWYCHVECWSEVDCCAVLCCGQWRVERGLGVQTLNPFPKFRTFPKAEPNSQFRGIYVRNNLTRVRVSLICKLSGTPD
jgi:hypothetical protein